MDSEIGFEMNLIVVEAICGRCASFMILTARVSEIFGGQTNSSILVVYAITQNHSKGGRIYCQKDRQDLDRKESPTNTSM